MKINFHIFFGFTRIFKYDNRNHVIFIHYIQLYIHSFLQCILSRFDHLLMILRNFFLSDILFNRNHIDIFFLIKWPYFWFVNFFIVKYWFSQNFRMKTLDFFTNPDYISWNLLSNSTFSHMILYFLSRIPLFLVKKLNFFEMNHDFTLKK